MFDGLSNQLGTIFDGLKSRARLSEDDVNTALRQVRVALLEADVALPVVKDFIARVKKRALGEEVIRSVTPGQMVVKIVHDALLVVLGEEKELSLNAPSPIPLLLLGLQGAGKTTTAAKLALRLKKENKKVLLASADVHRPAAQEQLRILGEEIEVTVLPNIEGESAVQIAKRARAIAKTQGYDVFMVDSAGRTTIDDEMMDEIIAVRNTISPHQTILVADSMTGQDAVNTAESFQEKVGIDGVVLTRIDGDARGGAALSMVSVTGCPILFQGVGERVEDIEPFHPDRMARRILGMGDVVNLVEKAQEVIAEEDAEKLARKMARGKFDLNDLADQLARLKKMGGLTSFMEMIPGLGNLQKKQMSNKMDDNMINRQLAMISSMTKKEREHPELIKASRKNRIAKGSGNSVQEINKLLKQFQGTQKMMKRLKKMGKGGLPQGMGGMDPVMMQEMQNMNPEQMMQKLPKNFM